MISELFSCDMPVLLAPMAGVTDTAYRGICREMGCDFSYTEMVSAKGLFYGAKNTARLLETSQSERPCGVQIFGSDPAIIADTVKRLCNAYSDEISIIDINMGCPAKKIVSNGEGSALMLDAVLASRVIESAVRASSLPVTVKFRAGFDEAHKNAVEFARMAEESGAACVTVHGRTREQMYSGRSDRDIIARVKSAVHIPVIGNGDVFSGADALELIRHTGCDGIMVARGAQGNPFIFREIKSALFGAPYTPPTDVQRIDMAIEHTKRLVCAKGERAAVEMRKHAAWYVHGLRGATKFRTELIRCSSESELIALLGKYKQSILDKG